MERLTELADRLACDPAFCGEFLRDPAGACRTHGLDEAAAAYMARSPRASVLEPRESRSSLAGALMAGALDGVAAVHHHGASPGLAAHTGRIAAVASAADTGTDPVAYPGDGASRERIAAWMADAAARHGLPRELPVMAALVESELQNLDHGDAASVGYFQMQTTYWLERYPGYPDKPELQLKWFIDQALATRASRPELARDPSRWGEWVAEIEQPAKQLRWKYGARLADAQALLHNRTPAAVEPGAVVTRTGSTPSVKAHGARGLNEVRQVRAISPHTGLQRAVDTPARRSRGDGAADELKAEASRIDRGHVPYQWGGGHLGAQAHGSPVTPLDCSGAVSRVLGIDPRVARDFESWGEPGPGRRVTIYAKDDHVLMEIDGHFWGTSRANPGGGAGWIPRRLLGDAYLAAFTARHPAGE
jgi:hypothetical protein